MFCNYRKTCIEFKLPPKTYNCSPFILARVSRTIMECKLVSKRNRGLIPRATRQEVQGKIYHFVTAFMRLIAIFWACSKNWTLLKFNQYKWCYIRFQANATIKQLQEEMKILFQQNENNKVEISTLVTSSEKVRSRSRSRLTGERVQGVLVAIFFKYRLKLGWKLFQFGGSTKKSYLTFLDVV